MFDSREWLLSTSAGGGEPSRTWAPSFHASSSASADSDTLSCSPAAWRHHWEKYHLQWKDYSTGAEKVGPIIVESPSEEQYGCEEACGSTIEQDVPSYGYSPTGTHSVDAATNEVDDYHNQQGHCSRHEKNNDSNNQIAMDMATAFVQVTAWPIPCRKPGYNEPDG